MRAQNLHLCHFAGKVTSCQNGQAISTEEFCDECQECPVAQNDVFALKSNCSKSSNSFCPSFSGSSKICMDKINVSLSDHCKSEINNNRWMCPNANSGLNFEQCYDT